MKGMSLPINIIVILIVVLLVLLAVAAFFAGGFGGGTGTMSDTAALQKGCGMWMSRGCKTGEAGSITILGYRPQGATDDVKLAVACNRVLGTPDTDKCWDYCCGGLNPAAQSQSNTGGKPLS
ncbi:MAG: hypothetical protein HZB66_03170 [Candidatus Aenigmarchaeota archaeon]|nr:hypothetical protein [Candidatus Aenigmarchaeota archaeon]